jgi:hypothetical protein
MDQKQFDKMIKGLVNPSRIKVCVNPDYDVLLSAENSNDTMAWFLENGNKLETNLREMQLKWAYIIETCPNDKPFIYMLISQTMTRFVAETLIDRAKRTKPENREIYVFEGNMRYIEIHKFDDTKATLEELLLDNCCNVIEVSEI